MEKNITCYLDKQAFKYPEKYIFIENDKNKITYKAFNKESQKIATNILKEKKLHNKPIAVFIDKSIDCLKSMFGIMYSGNFYCVFDVTSPKNRIDNIIETLKPELIITNDKNYSKISEYNYGIDILNISSLNYSLDNKLLNSINRCDTDPAYVLFTSGSTGVPKGSVITHKSLISYIDWFKTAFNINSRTVFGNQTPFYFSMSVSDVYSTIVAGATLCIIPKINFSFPIKLMEYLNNYKINTIYWVPSALSIVANLGTFDYAKPNYLKKVLFAGEVMTMPQLNIWRKELPKITYANLFGPTETTDICTYYVVNRKFKDNETLPIGSAVEGAEIIMINEEGKEAANGEVGELYVKGSIVGNGYYNNPEKTNAAFVQNPLHNNYPDIVYKTGDIGKINKYGEIEYLGRKDYQIKHMGYRIELGEIETNINSLKGLTICACIYDDIKSNIVLFYESNTLSEEDIIEYANQKLLKYMRPQKVVKLSKMPYNANGKIDRVKLKQDYQKGEN